MSEDEGRIARIKGKIAASQQRLRGETDALPAVPERPQLPDAYPPESYRSLAAEYPLLTVAAGAGIGLLIGALLPKGVGGKLGKRALSAAVVVGELGLALSQQAGDAAGSAGRAGLKQANEKAVAAKARVSRSGSALRSTGYALAAEAIKRVSRAKR